MNKKQATESKCKVFNILLWCGVLLCFIAGIIQNSDTKTRMYFGEGDGIQVEFSTYRDYEEFMNAKSSSITIYNDKSEFESIPDMLYISGSVKLPMDFPVGAGLEECEYKLELITKNGRSFTTTPMMYEEAIDKGVKNCPFIAYGRKGDVFHEVVFKTSGTELYSIKVAESK